MNDGRYTLIYPNGEYRTVRVRTVKQGELKGARILSIKEGHRFSGVAFISAKGKLNFWGRIKSSYPAERLDRIQKAFDRIVADPQAAGLAYAMKENCCCRCGRELTVPASIHQGLGPECAKKGHWNKDDQKAAYAWRQGQVAETKKHDDEWIGQKNLFAQEERKQEEKAFMSDPDLGKSWNGIFQPRVERPDLPAFENQRCGICGVPRYRCSC